MLYSGSGSPSRRPRPLQANTSQGIHALTVEPCPRPSKFTILSGPRAGGERKLEGGPNMVKITELGRLGFTLSVPSKIPSHGILSASLYLGGRIGLPGKGPGAQLR